MDQETTISIIVCTCDRPAELERFLVSLDSQTIAPDELIVVDASASNETRENLKKRIGKTSYNVLYIHSDPGLTLQRNRGIRESRGSFLYFFDDDVLLEREFLSFAQQTFLEKKDGRIGGLTGKITNIKVSDRKIDKMVKSFFFLSDIGKGFVKPSGFPAHRIGDIPGCVEVLTGCAMAYTREVVEKFAFDEHLRDYAYMEDVDYSFRISRSYRLYYQPLAKLQHLSNTHKKADTRKLRQMLVRNHHYLFKKNMPKKLINRFAFCMSIVGLVVYNLFCSRDVRAVYGIMEGLFKKMLVPGVKY